MGNPGHVGTASVSYLPWKRTAGDGSLRAVGVIMRMRTRRWLAAALAPVLGAGALVGAATPATAVPPGPLHTGSVELGLTADGGPSELRSFGDGVVFAATS